jgi:AcrR family transcriptional regulator
MILKDTILREAVRLTVKHPSSSITRRQIASAAGCAVGTVNYHYKTMNELREAIVAYAIEHEVVPLLSLLVGRPAITRRLTPDLRQRIAAHIAGK